MPNPPLYGQWSNSSEGKEQRCCRKPFHNIGEGIITVREYRLTAENSHSEERSRTYGLYSK